MAPLPPPAPHASLHTDRRGLRPAVAGPLGMTSLSKPLLTGPIQAKKVSWSPAIRSSLRSTCIHSGSAPELKQRKRIWAQCRAAGAALKRDRLSKRSGGAAATQRGLRGVRVGEAKNPGPSALFVALPGRRASLPCGLRLLGIALAFGLALLPGPRSSLGLSLRAGGASATQRGWRGCRVGDARLPGPSRPVVLASSPEAAV